MKIYKDQYQSVTSDCTKCFGLCCIALFFSKMDGFPCNKEAGEFCLYLQENYRCDIHKQLAKKKLSGCIGYDCFGAGNYVVQKWYLNELWISEEKVQRQMFAVFIVVTKLLQIRFYLIEACNVNSKYQKQVEQLLEENDTLIKQDVKQILLIDTNLYREKVNETLKQIVISLGLKKEQQYIGKSYRNKDMRNYDFSAKLLLRTDFTNAALEGSSFLAADTRDANFSNCDLRKVLFLSQSQVNCAIGNKNTKLPTHLVSPVTWK